MPGDAHSSHEPDDSIPEFVEVDPTNRYGRYSEVLGKGACKTVYRAFDELEGIEVAWNQVMVKDVTRKPADLERVYSELHLLQTLKHKNVIKFYGSWVDTENGNINFITEIFTSGNLRQYRQRHKRVDIRALKNWSRQILSGLFYLHNHDPPVIHRDLKCDNIFVNGSHGEVKIGDLGLAAILHHVHLARSVIGTPEFMAPEFYEEEYNELVDIYAFGMCLLELVTFEYPYSECSNPAQIYRRVSSGIKPASLANVTDIEVKKFIEKCIANVSERLSARELLMDPFLQSDVNQANYFLHPSLNHSDENSEQASRESSFAGDNKDMSIKDLTVKGRRKDKNKIFIKLRIPDSTGHVHNIHFPFDIGVDTSTCVASEMVTELNLTDQDVSTIAAMIDLEIQCHIPDWVGGETCCDQYDDIASIPEHLEPEGKDELTELKNNSSQPFGSFVLERLPSGRNYWSDSPRGSPTCTQLNVSSGSGPGASGQGITEVPGREDSHFVRNSHEGLHVGGVSLKNCDNPTNLICGVKDSSTDILSLEDLSLANKEHVSVDNGIVTENESEHMKVIAKKLECLLGDQQKELCELKKKHEEAIANILKDLPLEFRERNLCRFRLNAPDDIHLKH